MSAPVFATLGCRLNAYETEAMKELAAAAGLENAVIVNTCAVTAEALRKARQEIRRLRRDHPDATLIVTGCAAQTEPETFAAMPEVSRVIGNSEKMQAATWAAMTAPGLTGRRVLLDLDGGSLEIDWRDDGVWMTGPTAHVFDGRLTPAFLAART